MMILGPVSKGFDYMTPSMSYVKNLNCFLGFCPETLIPRPLNADTHPIRMINVHAVGNGPLMQVINGFGVIATYGRVYILRSREPRKLRTMKDALVIPASNSWFHVNVEHNRTYAPQDGDVIFVDCFNLPLHNVTQYEQESRPIVMKEGYQAIFFVPAVNDTRLFETNVLRSPDVLREARMYADSLIECFNVSWDAANAQLKVEWDDARGRDFFAESYPALEALEKFRISEEEEEDGVASRLVRRKREPF